jgi:anti-sigma B factor antagonist
LQLGGGSQDNRAAKVAGERSDGGPPDRARQGVEVGEQATFRRIDEPDTPRLIVEGEIDLGVAGEFASALKDLLAAANSPAVLDLTAVSFFNSTGIGVLCDAAAEARRRDITLIVEPSAHVRRTLEITGLTDNFRLR